MEFKSQMRITFNDLSFDKQEEIRNDIATCIKEDKELMDQIREEETKEWNESGEAFQKKLPLDRYIELKVDEVVMKNESKAWNYLDLQFEVEL